MCRTQCVPRVCLCARHTSNTNCVWKALSPLPALAPLTPWPSTSSYPFLTLTHSTPLHYTLYTIHYTLHSTTNTARSLESYHETLYKRLDKLLNVTQPRKSVMMAIDGPAPLAKLMTQRDRRKVGVY